MNGSTMFIKLIALALFGIALTGCGGDDPTPPVLSIDVFGYGDDFEGGTSWVSGMPNFSGAETAVFRVTQPFDRRVLLTESAVVALGEGEIPEVPFGENLRVEMEVLNGRGESIASGATAVFDFEPDDDARTLRLQVAENESFAPVGSVISVDGVRQFTQTRFDYRTVASQQWLGRLGHGSAVTSDRRVVVVGGGQAIAGLGAADMPEFDRIYDDIQIFDPRTGYFTDLAWNEATDSPVGSDKLSEPVAFPSVTAIGGDRFLVAGGFTLRAGEVRPTNSLQIIDLNAPIGERVISLRGSEDGSNEVLIKARGMHTASYRPQDNSVVIAGGIGPAGTDDYLDTFEVVDMDTNTVSGGHALQTARVGHTSTTLDDGGTIWIIGGRNADGVLASSELITGESSEADANLRLARFGHRTLPISASGGALLITVGGFADLDGSGSDSFEISGTSRGFLSSSAWALTHARGNPSVVQLPGTRDILVIGGRDSGNDVLEAERLEFVELGASNPYEVKAAGAASAARYWPSAHVTSTGRVALVGGFGVFEGSQVALDTIEFYNANDPVDGVRRGAAASSEE